MATVAILGAGSWGATLADLLHGKVCEVRLWDISEDVVDHLRSTRTSSTIPHLSLHPDIAISTSLTETLPGAKYILIAVPSHGVRNLCKTINEMDFSPDHFSWIICSKGIEEDSTLTLSGIMEEEFGASVRDGLCVLSGPSHAEEVSQKVPTSVTLASENASLALEVQRLLMTPYFRVYTHNDVVGVELAGSLKNVIAIAAGVCDGFQLGDNSKAALVTRGIAEITRLGTALGAHPQTFAGLAGIGDLIVTAYSRHSRNRAFGEKIARGLTPKEAQDEIGMVVEGVRTAHSAFQLSQRHNVPAPITEEVYNVIFKGKPSKEVLHDLMSRSPKPEMY